MNLRTSIMSRCVLAIPLAAIIFIFAGECATSSAADPGVDVPDNLKVTGPIIAQVHAQGFQVYTLKRDAAGKLAWTLKAPDATFENADGLKGKHCAGPTWECTTDGSKVVGKKIADHPSPAASAVPWLLLSAASHQGDGIFSTVTYIQRINTTGGKAPATGDAMEADEIRIAYTADYVFYGPGTTTQPATP